MAHPRIDGHIHLWADDHAKYPMGALRYPGDPPTPGPGPDGIWEREDFDKSLGQADYYQQGTAAALLKAQAEVGVHAAHAIDVVFHGYDSSYIEDCIAATPLRIRGSHVCHPASTPEKGTSNYCEFRLKWPLFNRKQYSNSCHFTRNLQYPSFAQLDLSGMFLTECSCSYRSGTIR